MGILKRKSATERVNELLIAGRSQEAISLCERICAKPQATARDWALYGQLNSDLGNLKPARTALFKAIHLDPDLVEAQFALGKLLATTGEYPQAVEKLEKAAQQQPENADIWLTLGITFGLMNQPEKAEAYCHRSLKVQPDSADAHFNLANALQAQGKLGDAEAEYQAALAIDPKMVNAWSMLAQVRFGIRQFDEAEAAANQALNLNPRLGEAYFTLGNIADALGRKTQAWSNFCRAEELLPDRPMVHMRLGDVLFDLERFIRASESFKRATDLAPSNTRAHFMLGQCFEKRKMAGRAENSYRQVVALDPDHLQAHYAIALICGQMNRHHDAAKHFTEVLRLNPHDEQAKHLLAAQQGKTTSTAPATYVASLFDGFADTFDQKLVDELHYRIPEVLYEMVNQNMSPEPKSMDVIDLGCGTGLCAPLFHVMAASLYGIDLSPRMIDQAQKRGLYDKLEVNDVASSLKAADTSWDLVLSSDVFVYIGDLREIFEACSRVLRPGGVFAFSVENGDDSDGFILRDTGRYAHSRTYIETLASDIGFSEIDRRDVVIRKDKGGVDINGHLFLLRRATDPVDQTT